MSHHVTEIKLDIRNKNITLTEEWTIGKFFRRSSFFSRSLHFEISQKWNVIQQIKKICGLTFPAALWFWEIDCTLKSNCSCSEHADYPESVRLPAGGSERDLDLRGNRWPLPTGQLAHAGWVPTAGVNYDHPLRDGYHDGRIHMRGCYWHEEIYGSVVPQSTK